MQVLSRQRDVSLIRVRRPGNAGGCPSECWAMRRRQRGFTLVELLITMAIALVLIMIAVPSFKNITLTNKLVTTTNDVIHAINVARMEAIKRNASTQLCSDSSGANTADGDKLGTECGTQVGAVYALSGDNPTQVLAGTVGITGAVQLSGNMTAIRFGGQGLGRKVGVTGPYAGIVADICTSQMTTDNHRVIRMTTGSILETTKATGDCP
jgi:type IV fimbrial biogenesis protein FimT